MPRLRSSCISCAHVFARRPKEFYPIIVYVHTILISNIPPDCKSIGDFAKGAWFPWQVPCECQWRCCWKHGFGGRCSSTGRGYRFALAQYTSRTVYLPQFFGKPEDCQRKTTVLTSPACCATTYWWVYYPQLSTFPVQSRLLAHHRKYPILICLDWCTEHGYGSGYCGFWYISKCHVPKWINANYVLTQIFPGQ